MTMQVIAHTDLTSTQSSITFSSIPGTGYTDLMLVFSVRNNSTAIGDSILVTLNSNTSNFSMRVLYGTGSSAAQFTQARWFGSSNGGTTTSNTFNSTMIYFPNYAGSANKGYMGDSVIENNATTGIQYIGSGIWSNTSAITSISFTNDTANGATGFVSGSSATLYGITAGSDGITTVS